MRASFLVSVSALLVAFSALAQDFPTKPDQSLTPGTLCEQADRLRYPERIKYCEREVDTATKYEVIQDYNRKLGFKIEPHQRSNFKIDHYIPLCMGGANDKKNLWPQHRSIYKHTDELEMVACQKLALGKITQSKAVDVIKAAKENYTQARKHLQEMKGL